MSTTTEVSPKEDPAVPQPTTETYEDHTPWVTGDRNDPLAYKQIYNIPANSHYFKGDENRLYPGWVLQMPNGGTYTVVYGDTLTWIAQGRGKGTYTQTLTRTVEPAEPTAEPPEPAAEPVPVIFPTAEDWRFRVRLAPRSDYLYNAPDPGILAPLAGKGVIFPYTPSVSVTYAARYDTNQITHSNYNVYTYQGSAVENITITGDFTAQDVSEANYMLAVIHFFRSATKMFYGQDKNRGVPPPLLYLSGLGEYQFDNHPAVLTNFTYTLPQDVDYINAYPFGTGEAVNGASLQPYQKPGIGRELGKLAQAIDNALKRLGSSGLTTRGKPSATSSPSSIVSNKTTRVPTKITITLTFNPMITRHAVSNKFSLADYASGKLLQGSKNAGFGGGMW